jgi:hypothetical protein
MLDGTLFAPERPIVAHIVGTRMPPVAVACVVDVDKDAAPAGDAFDADAAAVLREIEERSSACFRRCGPLSNEMNALLPSQISFPFQSPC